jgi:hypothetical protein
MVLDLEQAQADIEHWIVNFVEVPHPALGGWPPCPYARSARMKQSYSVRLGQDPYFDLKNLSRWGLGNHEVIIYVYDPEQWNLPAFSASLYSANTEFLLSRNIIALEDHPTDVEMVNGVCMNQGTYALALVQSVSDLNAKAQIMAHKGFYHGWPEEYLQGLFQHRQDPRQ